MPAPPPDATTRPAPPPPKHTATDLKADGCASLYTASLACLERAGYDKEACQDAFDAYKACRATEVRGGRKGGGWVGAGASARGEKKNLLLSPPCRLVFFPTRPSPFLTQYAAKRQARIDARRRG